MVECCHADRDVETIPRINDIQMKCYKINQKFIDQDPEMKVQGLFPGSGD